MFLLPKMPNTSSEIEWHWIIVEIPGTVAYNERSILWSKNNNDYKNARVRILTKENEKKKKWAKIDTLRAPVFSGRKERFRGRAPARMNGEKERSPPLRLAFSPPHSVKTNVKTSNYERLRNAGENDRRFKRSCSNDVHKFHVIDGLSSQEQITSARRTKRAFYSSHLF